MGKSYAEDLIYKAFTDSGKVGYYMLYRALKNAGSNDDKNIKSRLPE